MNCRTYKKWISLYLDGYLAEREEDVLFAHLDGCPNCSQYYDDMLTMLELLPEGERELPESFSAGWCARMARAKTRRVNYKVLVPGLAACLCCVFVISAVFAAPGGFLNVSSLQGEPKRATEETMAPQQPAAPMMIQSEPPEAAPTPAPPEQGSLFEDSTQAALPSPASVESSGTVEGVQVNPPPAEEAPPDPGAQASQADAEATPSIAPKKPAVPVIDATGKNLKKQIAAYAQENRMTATAMETGEGLGIEASPDALAALLVHFELKSDTDLKAGGIKKIEILCE